MASGEVAVAPAAEEEAEGPSWLAGKAFFWVPILPLIALDLWTKAAVFAFLRETYPATPIEHVRHVVWREPVKFELVGWMNTGTIWGLGKDYNLPLVVLRCLVLPLIVYFAYRTPSRKRVQLLVLGAILAGALGNLYDNLTQAERGVRDFLYFTFPFGRDGWGFPAFNVADACISVGAVTLAIVLWRSDARSRGRKGDRDGNRPPRPSTPAG